jgi:hypothetical protein
MTRNSTAISRRSNAAGPDASVFEPSDLPARLEHCVNRETIDA